MPPRFTVRRPAQEAFPEILGAAIAARGLTLDALRRRLAARGVAVSVSTLSYWRSGQRRPEGDASLEVLSHLEDILDIPEGELVRRLGPSRRPGPRTRTAGFDELMHTTEAQVRSIEQLGLGNNDDFDPLSIHVTLDLDDSRVVTRLVHRLLLRAAVDGVDRFPLVLRLEHPSERPVSRRVLAGGHLGRDVLALSPDLFASTLVQNQPLGLGETAVVEFETRVPDGSGFHYFEEHIHLRTHQTLIWVRFHPAVVPQECEVYRRDDHGEVAALVDLSGRADVHHEVRNHGPGTIGIRWRW